MGVGLSPYPYPLIFPQDEHERLLIERLAETGVEVERQTELLGFENTDGHVLAQIRTPNRTVETSTAAYIAGCDGARSTLREAIGIGFPGGTYEHLFYVADVEASGQALNGELHAAVDRTDFLVIFPLKGERRARLVGTVRDEVEQKGEDLSWDDVSTRVIEWISIDAKCVNWVSTYRVHHREDDHFRTDRVFLPEDAPQSHSP